MVKEKEVDRLDLIHKANLHIPINSTFVFISVTVLTFIISVRNELLQDSWLLAIQLSLCIPFFIYSNIARSRIIITPSRKVDNFGSWAYTIAFVFFLNSCAILLSTLAFQYLGIIFISVSILLMMIYEFLSVPLHSEKIFSFGIKRWLILLAGFVFLGLFPILKVY